MNMTFNEKVAVTGATGALGKIAIEKLKEKIPAENIVAIVRNPDKAKDLGVEIRTADYDDLDSYKMALKGIDRLYLISTSAQKLERLQQHLNVIKAAKENDVKHIVYTSLLKPFDSPLDLAPEHSTTEEMLKVSDIQYTIMRHGWYSENYIVPVSTAIQKGVLFSSAGDSKISIVPRADYAEAAAITLTSDNHYNKTYELGCDHPFTFAEMTLEIARQTGKDILYKNVSAEEQIKQLNESGMIEGFAPIVALWDDVTKKGGLTTYSKDLSMILGHPTTDLKNTVAMILDSLK
jgi:NAD(P)H dehydrogenase (quinone)